MLVRSYISQPVPKNRNGDISLMETLRQATIWEMSTERPREDIEKCARLFFYEYKYFVVCPEMLTKNPQEALAEPVSFLEQQSPVD
jgi:hypothetical protein